MITALLIEDDFADQQIFQRFFRQVDGPSQLLIASNLNEAKSTIIGYTVDIAFCDYNLPDGTANDFLKEKSDWKNFPIVVITSQGDVKRATESLKNGAFDYITKDSINTPGLERIILNVRRFRDENKKRAELQLKLDNNYSNTQAILDHTKDGIWSLNMQKELILINKRAKESLKKYLKCSPKIGQSFFTDLPIEYAKIWNKLFIKAAKGEYVLSIDKYFDGKEHFFLETACNPIYHNKAIQGVIFNSRNVTKRQNIDKALRESETNFRAVFEGSKLPILLESLDDNKIIDLNLACAKLHGYEINEMIGMNIFDTIPPEHLQKSQLNYQAFLKDDSEFLESLVYTKNNERIPVIINIAKIEYLGKMCNLLFLQDISEQKNQELALESAKRTAEESAEFKSQFLANMSHEIRTPMNAIIGFTELLAQTKLDTEQREFVNIIKTSEEDLMIIINDILDLSKIQAGKMELREEPIQLADLFSKIVKLHTNRAKKREIKLSLTIDKEVPEVLLTDETRLTQILNNLISNAIKFTEKGGVSIHVNCIKKTKNHANIQLKVKDSGIGIPEERLASIFNEFSQVDSSLQRQYSGTGLGLAIVTQMTKLMGGNIRAESTLGQGSTFIIDFKFKLGITEQLINNNVKNELEWASKNTLKLLIVEDNEVNVLLAKRVLKDLNLELKIAENGKIAIELVKTFLPDLIFMDIQMPIMDGYESAKQIRTFSQVPIFAMSAHVLEEERNKCTSVGMNGFIPKPFKKHEIIEVLASIHPSEPGIKPKEIRNDSLEKYPRLLELANGDKDFIKELLELFVKNGSHEINELEIAQSEDDFDQIKHLAHKLRSSFLILDFLNLSEWSIQLEENPNQPILIRQFIDNLKIAVKNIQDVLSNL